MYMNGCSSIIVPNWKHFKRPLSLSEWIHQVWYIHTMENYSAIKEGNVNIDNNVDTFQKILFKTGPLTWRIQKERGKSLQIW